jgi:hypothetical protein
MEGEGFWRAMAWAEERGLLPLIKEYVCNQDSSVLSILHSDDHLQHISIQHDPGHTKNTIIKMLHQVLGQSKVVEGFAEWIGNWVMTVIKQAVLHMHMVHLQISIQLITLILTQDKGGREYTGGMGGGTPHQLPLMAAACQESLLLLRVQQGLLLLHTRASH